MSNSPDETTDAVAREIDNAGVGPAAMAALGSVALALYYYYVRGKKQRGQFVGLWPATILGLWPATILGLAAYLKLNEIKALLEEDEG